MVFRNDGSSHLKVCGEWSERLAGCEGSLLVGLNEGQHLFEPVWHTDPGSAALRSEHRGLLGSHLDSTHCPALTARLSSLTDPHGIRPGAPSTRPTFTRLFSCTTWWRLRVQTAGWQVVHTFSDLDCAFLTPLLLSTSSFFSWSVWCDTGAPFIFLYFSLFAPMISDSPDVWLQLPWDPSTWATRKTWFVGRERSSVFLWKKKSLTCVTWMSARRQRERSSAGTWR